MHVLIYTKDDDEYMRLKDVFTVVSGTTEVYRDPLDGHGHYSDLHDIVVIALDGAKGLNELNEWADRSPKTKIIWITDDKEFAGVAIKRHVSDFIVRPYTEEGIKESITETVNSTKLANRWHIAVN